MDGIVSSIVHLANADYGGLVDDFVHLQILPGETNRPIVEPLMGRVLGPYVSGGGGLQGAVKAYGKSGFQQMSSDLLSAM